MGKSRAGSARKRFRHIGESSLDGGTIEDQCYVLMKFP
jgi:hypothetical protein